MQHTMRGGSAYTQALPVCRPSRYSGKAGDSDARCRKSLVAGSGRGSLRAALPRAAPHARHPTCGTPRAVPTRGSARRHAARRRAEDTYEHASRQSGTA